MSALKSVGYWRADGERQLPLPQWFVRPDWQVGDRSRIVAYLRSGHVFAEWLGYSQCRFNCGINDSLMGASDLTDGQWVWPAGLAHYVEVHSVCLPEQFVDAMRDHEWCISVLGKQLHWEPGNPVSDSFWIEWAIKHRRRPWYVLW